MKVENKVEPNDERAKAFFGNGDDGPLTILNLLKFRKRTIYEDGRAKELSGTKAYAIYGAQVATMIATHSGRVRYVGSITDVMLGEIDAPWNQASLVDYPNLNAF
ncbi:MAG: DUF1330 domain-containing protein [Pseudomonadota bacterium]